MKMDGSVLQEKQFLKILGRFSLLNSTGAPCIVSIAKTASKKVGALLYFLSFFFLSLLFMSVNVQYTLAWNTVVMFGLVLLTVTWICQINYRNRYVGVLVVPLLPLLNPSTLHSLICCSMKFLFSEVAFLSL